MLSIKLHEATKKFKISNKLAMFFLERTNLPVKSHSSVITMDQLEMLKLGGTMQTGVNNLVITNQYQN